MQLQPRPDCNSRRSKSAINTELSFEERFGLLVDEEYANREDKRLARLLKSARLRLQACMEDIDYGHRRGLKKTVMASLSTCQWIRGHQNILMTGPTGVGKTYIVCALANNACRHGFSARYYRVPTLLMELVVAQGDGSYPNFMKRLSKTDLVVLDDWGLGPFTAGESRNLLEVLEARTQLSSTIISSQLPVEKWYQLIPDPTVADAIMDRVIHLSHRIALDGESMRKTAISLGKGGDS